MSSVEMVSRTSGSRIPKEFGMIRALIYREFLRFFRQRSRVIGAVVQPLIFWILFGAGLKDTFKPPAGFAAQMSYQEYFFPGILALILMFTAIFSTISLIEDRKEGFLQGILVSPSSRWGIVLGKILAGSLLACTQVMLFLLVIPILGLLHFNSPLPHLAGVDAVLEITLLVVLIAFSMTSLGYLIAWPMESTQGFHAIMSIVLMPMWLLSGAFFPIPSQGGLAWLMWLNPMTYNVIGLQRLCLPMDDELSQHLPSLGMCLLVTIGFTIVCFIIDVKMTQRTGVKDSR